MSGSTTDLDRTAIRERLADAKRKHRAASDMVLALCKPRGTPGAREWLMSIPRDEERDPDIVIHDALDELSRALSTIEALLDERERLREALNWMLDIIEDDSIHEKYRGDPRVRFACEVYYAEGPPCPTK